MMMMLQEIQKHNRKQKWYHISQHNREVVWYLGLNIKEEPGEIVDQHSLVEKQRTDKLNKSKTHRS